MSAFVVSDRHIEALVYYAQHPGARVYLPMSLHPHVDEQRIADILRAENVRSIRARYGNTADELIPDEPVMIRPASQRPARLSHVAAIKACDCYDNQACETMDYANTTAARIISAIRSAAVASLPGYDGAAWSID